MFCSAGTFGCATEGDVRAIDGPRTDVADTTTMSYYQGNAANCGAGPDCDYRRGDLASAVNALGHRTSVAKYDKAGRLLESVFDGSTAGTDDDIRTVNTYSPRGWLLSTSVSSASAPSAIRSFEHDAVGNLIRSTQADGAFMRYIYDDANRLIRLCDNTSNSTCTTGNRIEYTLDAMGNRLTEKTYDNASLMRSLAREINGLNRLSKSLDAANRETAVFQDSSGNQRFQRDALGVHTEQQYDPLNRLISTIQDRHGSTLTDVLI